MERKRVTYQEAYDWLLKNTDWDKDSLDRYAEGGRILIINMYNEKAYGEHYGEIFPDSVIFKGREVIIPMFKRKRNETFEEAVKREFNEYGYSDTLDLLLEDCIAGRSGEFLKECVDDTYGQSEREDLLEYLTEMKNRCDPNGDIMNERIDND